MPIHKNIPAVAALFAASHAFAHGPALGQPLADDDIPIFARYITPDGGGLPNGSGTATEGAVINAEKRAGCQRETGVEGPVMPPVGPNDVWAKPAGSYWRYATTLFAYIKRAMPLEAPKSLTDDEVYALAAFILARNGVIDEGEAMTAESLPAVEMPNRDNFTDVWALQGAKPWE